MAEGCSMKKKRYNLPEPRSDFVMAFNISSYRVYP